MIRAILSVLLLLWVSILSYGQISTDKEKIKEYYYNLPVDSCFQTILDKSSVISQLSEVHRDETNKFIKFKANNPGNGIDSIHIQISQFSVAIGSSSSPNFNSPFSYEHWAGKTSFFHDSLSAKIYFENLRQELNKMELRFTPYELLKNNGIEIVYSTPIQEESTLQIHFSYITEKGIHKVELNYRRIFENKQCN